MSLKFKNIDSIFDTGNNLRIFNIFNYNEVESRLIKITKDFWGHHIYLISPELMDIIYPKTKREGIDLGAIEVNIELFNIPKWTKYRNQHSIAIGVYCGNFNPNSYSKKLSKFSSANITSIISNISGPSIFICPERVYNCTTLPKLYGLTVESIINLENEIISLEKDIKLIKELDIPSYKYKHIEEDLRKMKHNFEKTITIVKQEEKSFNTLFLKVCLHEIAHHYLSKNTPNYNKEKWKSIKVNKVAHKLIEESLANAFAWSQFSDQEELNIIETFMDSQPFEYSAYRFWIKGSGLKKCVPFLMSSWKNKIDPFIPEYLFENIDEVLSDYYHLNSYKMIKEHPLDFNFDQRRLWNSTIGKVKSEKNFWEAVAKSIIYYFKTNKKVFNQTNS